MINTVNVAVVKDGVVFEMFSFHDNTHENEQAEKQFLDSCKEHVSNWDDYAQEDIDKCMEDGYCKTGVGSVCLTHSDGGFCE